MGRGRLEVLVDNAWRTHVGRRRGEGCYDTYRSVLYGDPRASPWPFRVTGVSYARARQRPGGLTVSPRAQFGTASGSGRKCGEKNRSVGRRAAPRTAGRPWRGRDTCGSEGQPPAAVAPVRWPPEGPAARILLPPVPLVAHTWKPSRCDTRPLHAAVTRYTRPLHATVTRDRYTQSLHTVVIRGRYTRRHTRASHAGVTRGRYTRTLHTVVTRGRYIR